MVVSTLSMHDDSTFSIVTPSFNMGASLKLCARSVADQQSVRPEHIVVDGGSRDGTKEWLREHSELVSVSERDDGMYDALNKGFSLATGNLIGQLNCDEQYLPGTLEFVQTYFAVNPAVDMVFGDALIIRPDGSLLAYRKAYKPREAFIWTSHMYLLTCAMFFRRRILDDGLRFSTEFKAASDETFLLEILQRRYLVATVPRYMAAFFMTGANLGSTDTARREIRAIARRAPPWMRACKVPLNVARIATKLASGAYHQRVPLQYEVYTSDSPERRHSITAHRASFRWRTG